MHNPVLCATNTTLFVLRKQRCLDVICCDVILLCAIESCGLRHAAFCSLRVVGLAQMCAPMLGQCKDSSRDQKLAQGEQSHG